MHKIINGNTPKYLTYYTPNSCRLHSRRSMTYCRLIDKGGDLPLIPQSLKEKDSYITCNIISSFNGIENEKNF